MKSSALIAAVLSLAAVSCLTVGVDVCAAADAPPAVDYVRDVKPILQKHCYECHGADKQKSGLRVDTAAAILTGGDSGPAIEPGKSDESVLIQAVTAAEGATKMPPRDPPLSAAEIEVLRAWIAAGAKAPVDEVAQSAKPAKSNHWSFQPVVRAAAPVLQNAAWVRNPIDAFVLARLEKQGIKPAPEADRVTLIRRLSFDLLGLPPSPAEVDAFVADSRPEAYEELVDRLLTSPHFGERCGRQWLDLARYADSNGYTIDSTRLIWKYRDWVIEAFNRDLPFDRFTIEQIAGDMLPEAELAQKIATGFHRNTLFNEEGGTDPEQFRVEAVSDRVSTTSSVFLGLTIGCAQCHDHKYDPIAQREYYQLFAFLNNAEEPICDVPTPEQVSAGLVEKSEKIRSQVAEMEESVWSRKAELELAVTEWEKGLTDAQKEDRPLPIRNVLNLSREMRKEADMRLLCEHWMAQPVAREKFPVLAEIVKLRASAPQFITTLVMQERTSPRKTRVHLRGDFLRKGARVAPGVPAVLPPLPAELKSPTRLDLAKWLVDPANPLTPRVTMNRLWQKCFGRGIVETENDFGTQGERPTHPELLDWLASELIARRWSMKAMHKAIVMSATYRQSSRVRPDLADVDPQNKLYARQSRLRLDAELIRDTALAASGLLSRKIGGPSVNPPQPAGVFDFTQHKKDWTTSTGDDRYRRGMYTYLWRSSLYPAMTVFDFPDANTTCTRRNRSNTPLQSLTLANDAAFVEFAQGLALRVMQEGSADDGQKLARLFRLCLARAPRTAEQSRLAELLAQQRSEFRFNPAAAEQLAAQPLPATVTPVEAAAWTAMARVVLNLDEFITRE